MKAIFLVVAVLAGCISGKTPICKDGKGIQMLVQPNPNNVYEIGDKVKLECVAHGYPTPYVSWTKGQSKSPLGPVSIGTSTLFFAKLKKENVDYYQCVVEDCCSGKKTVIETEISTINEIDCGERYGGKNDVTVYGMKYQHRNFTSAGEYCNSQGMEMAMPLSKQDNAQLLKDIKKSFKRDPNANKYAHDNWVWLGAHDCCGDAEEGTFRTMKGENLTYFNWQRGQPDNWFGKKSDTKEGQDGVSIFRKSGKWDDSFVANVRPFVCKCPEKENILTPPPLVDSVLSSLLGPKNIE